jgi:hypothetical protein
VKAEEPFGDLGEKIFMLSTTKCNGNINLTMASDKSGVRRRIRPLSKAHATALGWSLEEIMSLLSSSIAIPLYGLLGPGDGRAG